MIKRSNKKGAIGATLTWMVATFIILFILIIFIVFAVALSLTKDRIEIKPEASTKTTILSSNTLMFLMNMPIVYNGQEIKIKELIEKWSLSEGNDEINKIKDKIKEEVDKTLTNSLGGDGYIFYAELESAKKKREQLLKEREERLRKATMTAGGEVYDSEIEKGTLKFDSFKGKNCNEIEKAEILNQKAVKIFIISEKEKIEVKLYFGEC